MRRPARDGGGVSGDTQVERLRAEIIVDSMARRATMSRRGRRLPRIEPLQGNDFGDPTTLPWVGGHDRPAERVRARHEKQLAGAKRPAVTFQD